MNTEIITCETETTKTIERAIGMAKRIGWLCDERPSLAHLPLTSRIVSDPRSDYMPASFEPFFLSDEQILAVCPELAL
jgi:hypothetical protein